MEISLPLQLVPQPALSLVDLGKQLLESAKNGETEEVRHLMTSGAPFTTDWLGTSPLHMAAQYGHLETAEVLLRAGISRDARTKVDRTPLHVAAQEGHLEIVELLLKHSADIEAKDMLRMTPLHWAVERGHVNVINCLLRWGADVNACSKFDKSPLNVALDNDREDLAQLLQDHMNNPTPRVKPVAEQTFTLAVSSVATKPATVVTATSTAVPKTVKGAPVTVTIATSGTVAAASTSTKAAVPRNIYFQPKVPKIVRTVGSNASKSTSSSVTTGDDQGSTSVLATLAALAEATAPNTTLTSTEAVQWLETHGITMLPADNSTIVASALEGGQTISLTDAGKLALNWVKDQQVTTAEVVSTDGTLGNVTSTAGQKVIAIVTDQTQVPSVVSGGAQSQFVVVSSSTLKGTDGKNSHVIIKTPTESPAKRPRKASTSDKVNGKLTVAPEVKSEGDQEKDMLHRELEALRKQAEQYKAQLEQKEHEAELYKKQLEEMKTVANN